MTFEFQLSTVDNPDLYGRYVLNWHRNEKLFVDGLKVLERHRFTCKFCGFKSRPSRQVPHGYMVPIDWRNNSNISVNGEGECVCPFCASVLGINWSVEKQKLGGKEMPSPGVLMFCPHLTQIEVNRIALHVASLISSRRVGSTPSTLESAARDVDAIMVSLNQELGAELPIYKANDGDFARALSMLAVPLYEQRKHLLSHVRWWPTVSFWQEQGVYWNKAFYEPLSKTLSKPEFV
ncbi:TPA: hypothetical protein ACGW3M_001204 [Pseudomonas aeruginosa]|nr:hypothetical protein [Pseudomonas aeruginosa]ELJ2278110.1 hypothetical protein [Pseudomonas aeruginosa]